MSTCMITACFQYRISALETTDELNITGTIYSTDVLDNDDECYQYSDGNTIFRERTSQDAAGKLRIIGDQIDIDNNRIIVLSQITNGKINVSYNLSRYSINKSENDWYLSKDNEKNINGIDLNGKMNYGALIVECSRDGINWNTVKIEEDIFNKDVEIEKVSYDISPLQIQNGTYFRFTIAYQLKRIEKIEKGFLGIKKEIIGYTNNVEVYEFYIESNEITSNNDPNNTPRHVYKENFTAVKNDGKFSTIIDLKDKNPQYSEIDRIGYFVLNGYSGNPTKNENGNYTYTKNTGDDITLWFCPNKERIESLDILDITDALDKDLKTKATDFHSGALFIKFTNTEGNYRVIEYYDFLNATSSPYADTSVRIYEEGEYEVVFDYGIEEGLKKYNYRMHFLFEVKNGNCMVFFRDSETTSELSNMAFTKKGFKVDFAGSKDLDVIYQRSVINIGSNGLLIEDIRENKNANDLEAFTKEGIYTFTIRNRYTGQTVNKTLYIGDSKYIKAMSRNAIDVRDLNDYIKKGYEITNDGELILNNTSDNAVNEIDGV